MAKLHLHIGPHKTATTHMQNVLEHSRFADGIGYVPLWKVRKTLSSNLNHGKPVGDVAYLDSDGLTIVSEENLSGFPAAGMQLYPSIARLMAFFAGREVEVYFSPRNYGAFFPSVYCEALRFGRYFEFPKAAPMRGWLDVLSDVEAALPDVPIKLWFYEDYRGNWREIIQYLAAGGITAFGDPPKSDPRSSLSGQAIATYAAMHEHVTDPNQVLDALADALPSGVRHPKFAPFAGRQLEGLSERYYRDCEVLAARYDCFQPTPLAVSASGGP